MTRFIALGGFLGSGKTTTIVRAAQELSSRGEVVAVVTNDQGADLVDTATVRDAAGPASGEVVGGCFCCRFDDLVEVVEGLLEEHRPTVVLAEAVGSCTDLQSTVVRPLRALLGDPLEVAPLVVLVDPARYRELRGGFGADGRDATDLVHLYHHQLAEADVIALNKTDALPDAERDHLLTDLRRRFPRTRVVACAAATGAGIEDLLDVWWGGPPGRSRPFTLDYGRYGAAEAELAWTNQVFEISGRFTADAWLDAFFAGFTGVLGAAPVGHVKVRVATARGCAKGSLVATGTPMRRDAGDPEWTTRATALVNARVATTPAALDALVLAGVAAADAACSSRSERCRGEVFRPGAPVPVHRM